MTFTDDLTLVLDLLILVACAVFYTGFWVWFEMRRGDRVRAQTHLRGGALLLGSLAAILGLIALWGEFTWPLVALTPTGSNVLASYDLLFFDSLVLLSLLLGVFAIAVRFRLPTHFVGMLGVVIGSGIIYYGYRAYTLSLTLEPLETLLLFVGFGAMAILSYPVTLYLDWFVVGPSAPGADPIPSDPKPRYPMMWTMLLGLFLLVVVLAGIAALFYGFDSAWAHLAAPP
jgi:putative membrane protein